ncbi:L-type lectin-domain containing receptor kinase IX.1-like [Vigna unguiculata]|uniref:L-type lectin-domain containing receptor kinase IX.1-like n=1 Tax=Vigna unguiculata TaxID=3917 RepID=UPI00101717B4|nr:L-type lectin-domain containing receptor kinase IX.1-like [Vigna unguiculata]
MLATMARFHNIKTFLLCYIFLVLPLTIAQPLSFNITNFNDTQSASLVGYAGVAKTENRSIVLNSLVDNGIGRAIYGLPLRFKNSSNGHVTDFSTRFSFTIDVSSRTDYGDGFAFYVAPLAYPIPSDSGGGGLGLYGANQDNIIAVEFDTFPNANVDPPMKHVGINNNSLVSLNSSLFDIDSNIGNMGHVLITYSASAKLLAVSWFFEETSSGFMPNTSLSYQIDLGEILPEWVTVGFSGATGLSNEENVIHSWELTSTLNSTQLNSKEKEGNNGITVKYKFSVQVVVVAVSCSVLFMLVVAAVSWFIIIQKRRNEHDFGFNGEAMPRRFGYEEIVAATNGFADDRRLGEGGTGQVYKGFLSDLGRVVAVKRIFSDVEDSEGIFTNEVKIISRLVHKNLVQLMGWCHEQGELLLVFEYMSNGSLDTHIFGNRRTLTWGVRYNIALGVARALRYLHEEVEQCVLHRDIKSSNVLLDTDFNTKVSDFGIAKLVDPRLRTQKTRVVGTYGYLAPEYVKEGRASKESDMYGFGVVALEIGCGRRTYQDGEYNHVPLTNWVWKKYVDGNILDAADEGLKGDYDVEEMRCLLTLGIWCTHPDHRQRPKAEQVINTLKQETPLPMLSL